MPQGQLAGPKSTNLDTYYGREKFDNAGNAWVYAYASINLVANTAYRLNYTSRGVEVVAFVAAAAEYCRVVVAEAAATAGDSVWVKFRGEIAALVVANDTYLINEALIIFDGTVIGTNAVPTHLDQLPFAVVLSAVALAAVAAKAYLIGKPVVLTTT